MVYFEKSQPAPECLAIEKAKAYGDYKCGDVLNRLKIDFKNKCYICEIKAPIVINVEHFISHQGDKDLKFSWENLFWSCGHCNNTKLAKYNNLLNCTDENDHIENRLRYVLNASLIEQVEIESLDNSPKTLQTRDLLHAIYNGTTPLKRIESSNLREQLLKEMESFNQDLLDYFSGENNDEDKEYYLDKIKTHLNRASSFTAFKLWVVRDEDKYKNEFEKYFE